MGSSTNSTDSSGKKIGRFRRFLNFIFRRNKKKDQTSNEQISTDQTTTNPLETDSAISEETDSQSSNDSEDTKEESNNSELKEDEDENKSSDNSSNSFE